MFADLIQALLLASGGILSVGSITIVILLLMSERGGGSGAAYAAGYVGAYTLIGLAAVVVGTSVREGGSDGRVSSILFSGLGLLLIWMGGRNWRKPAGEGSSPPRFFNSLDKLRPGKALAFGALVGLINFKNLAIYLSAISVLVVSERPLAVKTAMVLVVVLVFCSAVIAPVVIHFLFPAQSHERLEWIRRTLEAKSRPIGIWVPLLFGLIFFIRGVTGLL